MGDIGYNRSFGLVEQGEESDYIELAHKSILGLSIFNHLGWFFNLIVRTRLGSKDTLDWVRECLAERKKITPEEKDVFSWLLDTSTEKVTPTESSDSLLMVNAGSDTTAATLTWAAYELCKQRDVQIRLRKEIDMACPKKGHLDVAVVAHIPFLDGFLNEVLRLHPAVPGGAQRETPPEGVQLPNGTYVPGGVNVWVPIHCLQRDPRYFLEPLEFMPERWTSERPEAVLDKRAFIPFSTGSASCVGQRLAMMETRSVIANLVKLFDVSFAEGEDGSSLEEDTRDCFAIIVAKLDIKLTPRS